MGASIRNQFAITLRELAGSSAFLLAVRAL
jgi:hypothetical protein